MRIEDLPLRPVSVDFEFIPGDDGTQTVICMSAERPVDGAGLREVRPRLRPGAAVPLGSRHRHGRLQHRGGVRFVHAAGVGAAKKLHRPLRRALEGDQWPTAVGDARSGGPRGSLLAALRCHGLPARQREGKRRIIGRILAGPPYSQEERRAILDYCAEDVLDAEALLGALLPQMEATWWGCALVRGRYSLATAKF